MTEPYLSLALLTRDPEGVATLERAIRSALERPDGPMCDEIVVLFGGSPHDKCREIIARLATEVPAVAWQWLTLPTDIPLTEEGGLADFAAARNYLYSMCRGAWIGYIDADDVIPSAEAASAKTPGSAGHAAAARAGAEATAALTTMKAFLKHLPPAFNSVTFAYHYAHDVEGNVIVESSREWVRWRDGFTWVNRAPGHHEAIFPVYPNKRNIAELKGFYLEHRPPDDTHARRMRRNDALLDAAKYLQESVHGMTDRWGVQHYLARQAERRNLYELAAQHGEQCVALARNDEEKYSSLHGLARVLRCIGKHVESMSAALLAYNLAPLRGEAIADVLLANLETGDAVRAAEWYGHLLELPESTGQVGIEYNAYEVDLWPHVAASRALLALELFDQAVAAAQRAVAFAPYDVGATKVLKEAIAARDLRRARDAGRFLIYYAAHRDSAQRVRRLFENLPYVLEHDQDICTTVARVANAAPPREAIPSTAVRLMAEAKRDHKRVETIVVPYGTAPDGPVGKDYVYTPERLLAELSYPAQVIERLERIPPDDTDPYREGVILARYLLGSESPLGPRVTIFCPEFKEPWGPFSPERTGIGGSEEMVILVARYLSRQGANVTVYAPVTDVVVDCNVVWRPFQTFDPDASCDVLISHRTAHLARREKLGAKVHYAWLHDAVVTKLAEDYEEARRSRVKAYLTLSAWQEEEYHKRFGIPHDQMLRVPNAPDPDDRLSEDESQRVSHKAIYASAPYRGLNVLLAAWPRVRERVPDAELHICNDWRVHDELAKVYPELSRLKDLILAHKDAPGVIWRGRLTAQALRHEFQTAGVFAYPTTFMETSCRAAIRAMACGCMPVYRPLAALEETIGPLGRAVPGTASDLAYAQAFGDAVAEAMLNPPPAEDRRALSEDAIRRHDPWNAWRAVVWQEAVVEVAA